MADLAELVATRDTIVVIGPGGVGKTTTSAAIAVHAAKSGRNVLVLTVDPARRLASALGLGALGNEEQRVSPAHFAAAGISLGAGALHAMMLDTKHTFDAVVERHAPSKEARDKILNNRFYAQASSTLAGSQEYMAMEKLYELREERDYDLLVLDTPPAVNAEDFFSAPERLTNFLDSGSLSLLLNGVRRAGRFGFGFFNSILAPVMNRFIGVSTFIDLLNFIEAFSSMFGGFKARADRVSAMLRSPSTGFVIVSSTEAISLNEASALHKKLDTRSMPFGAMIINRVRPPYVSAEEVEALSSRLEAAAERHLNPEDQHEVAQATEAVLDACRDHALVADMDAARIDDVAKILAEDAERLWTVPLFRGDVHDIKGLSDFADHVFEAEPFGAAS